MMAGESASRLGKFDEAIQLCDRAADSPSSDASTARWAAGEVLMHLGRMSPTIAKMERSLELDSHNYRARERLIYLLNLAGRRWSAVEHLFEMVRQDRWTVQQLLYLGNTAKSVENEPELQSFLSASPEDRMPLLGLARIRMRAGEYEQAERLLTQVLERFPHLVEAQEQMGKLWLQVGAQQIPAWNRALPKAADAHPDIWHVRGEWARDHQQLEAAVRCFAEAVRLDPDHLAALNGLAQVLTALGQSDRVSPIMQRTARLEKLLYALEHIMSNEWTVRQAASPRQAKGAVEQVPQPKEHVEPVLVAARLTLDLGRAWESLAWSHHGLSIDPTHEQLRLLAETVRPKVDSRTPRTLAEAHVVDASWFSSFPLPNWESSELPNDSIAANSPRLSNSQPGFQNGAAAGSLQSKAVDRGLIFEEVRDAFDFTYIASRHSFSDGRRMFEMTGGGVGVLDYDRDGWPDVFLTQGSNWPSATRVFSGMFPARSSIVWSKREMPWE